VAKKFLSIFLLAVFIASIFFGCTWINETEIKRECLEAITTGIKLDIQRLEGYLNLSDLQNRSEVESTLIKLKEDLNKYQSIKTNDYVLEESIEIKGYLGEKYVTNSIIYLENQSKSGPFYHAVKVMDDKGEEIVPNEIYTFKVYPVYKRYYPFEAWYVFVSDFEK